MKRSLEMSIRTTGILVGAALAIAVSVPMIGRADDKEKTKALKDAVVQFAQKQPQAGGPTTHFLNPDDVTIQKGGTVTFHVNGAAHGIAIHPVSKNTTREDIAKDLCQGGANDADRAGRALVCNATIVTGVDAIVGTQNLNYDITDGEGNLIISTGINTAATPNPRVDDAVHTHRLLATSGRVRACGTDEKEPACDSSAPGANPAGAFLTGSAAPATPGNRIRVRFTKTGRYLVICMNRGHSLNDHMFGFVSVVDDDDDN
jgi:plastocyanin